MEAPKILESLKNVKNAKLGDKLSFKLIYSGFKEIPQSILWFHDNKLINSNDWNIVVGKTSTEIFKENAVLGDQGEYNCRIQDTKVLGASVLESFAYLLFDEEDLKKKLSKSTPAYEQSSLLLNNQNDYAETSEVSPLTLRCPLPDVIKRNSQIQPRIQWLHNSQVIYDSSTKLSTLNERFVIGKTVWHARLSGNQAILSSEGVHKNDSGKYTCRIYIGEDVYESIVCISPEGELDVLEIPQIVRKLPKSQVKMIGETLELACELKPIANGKSTIYTEWYHNGKLIDADYAKKCGIVTSENPINTHFLRIENIQENCEGAYRFVARLPGGTAESVCQILIEEPIQPKIFGNIDGPDSVKRGDTVQLSVDYVAYPKPNVKWLKDNQEIFPDAKFNISNWSKRTILQIKDFQQLDCGNYLAIVSNTAGSDRISSAFNPQFEKRTVSPSNQSVKDQNMSRAQTPPNYSPFLLEPDNIRVRNGDLVRFCCLLKPELIRSDTKISWFYKDKELFSGDVLGQATVRVYSDTPIKGAHQLEINPVGMDNAGCYHTKVTSGILMKSTECENWLEVEPTPRRVQDRAPPKIESPIMSNYTIKEGEPFQMNIRVSGRPVPEVVWIKDGLRLEDTGLLDDRSVQISGDATNHRLTIPKFENRHSGHWTMIANNPSGLITSSTEIKISPIDGSDGSYRSYGLANNSSSGNDIDFNQTIEYRGNDQISNKTNIRTYSGIPIEPGDRVIYPRARSISSNRVLNDTNNYDNGLSRNYERNLNSSTPYQDSGLTSRNGEMRTQLNLSNSVQGNAPEFQKLFKDTKVRPGDTVRLDCRVKGNPEPDVWWTFNGETLDRKSSKYTIQNNGHDHSLTIYEMRPEDMGRYSITAENKTGIATCSALVYQDPVPVNFDTYYRGSTSPLHVNVPSSASPTGPRPGSAFINGNSSVYTNNPTHNRTSSMTTPNMNRYTPSSTLNRRQPGFAGSTSNLYTNNETYPDRVGNLPVYKGPYEYGSRSHSAHFTDANDYLSDYRNNPSQPLNYDSGVKTPTDPKYNYDSNNFHRRYQPRFNYLNKNSASPTRSYNNCSCSSPSSVRVNLNVKLKSLPSDSCIDRIPVTIERQGRMTREIPDFHKSCEFVSKPSGNYDCPHHYCSSQTFYETKREESHPTFWHHSQYSPTTSIPSNCTKQQLMSPNLTTPFRYSTNHTNSNETSSYRRTYRYDEYQSMKPSSSFDNILKRTLFPDKKTRPIPIITTTKRTINPSISPNYCYTDDTSSQKRQDNDSNCNSNNNTSIFKIIKVEKRNQKPLSVPNDNEEDDEQKTYFMQAKPTQDEKTSFRIARQSHQETIECTLENSDIDSI